MAYSLRLCFDFFMLHTHDVKCKIHVTSCSKSKKKSKRKNFVNMSLVNFVLHHASSPKRKENEKKLSGLGRFAAWNQRQVCTWQLTMLECERVNAYQLGGGGWWLLLFSARALNETAEKHAGRPASLLGALLSIYNCTSHIFWTIKSESDAHLS